MGGVSSKARAVLGARRLEDLPAATARLALDSQHVSRISVRLAVVTSIFGGYQTRKIEDFDVIRVPSVCGHLRFWRQALYAAQHANRTALYERESVLWGRAANEVPLKVPAADEAEVKIVLRAWILFGGYGARTRSGLGSLKVSGDANGCQPIAPLAILIASHTSSCVDPNPCSVSEGTAMLRMMSSKQRERAPARSYFGARFISPRPRYL